MSLLRNRAGYRAPRSRWRKGKKRVTVSLPDLAEFERLLKEYEDQIIERAQKVVARSKGRFVRNAMKAAPVKTGALKRSIRAGARFTDRRQLYYRVVPISYAIYVEFVPPRIPFFYSTFMKERVALPRALKRLLKQVTKELARDITQKTKPKAA